MRTRLNSLKSRRTGAHAVDTPTPDLLTVRFNLQMSVRMYTCLNRVADETGLSVAELIRRAIDLVYRPYLVPRLRAMMLAALMGTAPTTEVARRPGKRLAD